MESNLLFRLSGEGIEFGKFSMTKFLEISNLYFSIIKKIMKSQNPEMDLENIDFVLQSIADGSIEVSASCNAVIEAEEAVETFIDVSLNSQNNDYSHVFIPEMITFGNKIKQSGAHFELLSSSGKMIEIIPEKLQFKRKTIKEYSTIYGKLVQVGGGSPNAHIDCIFTERRIICDVSHKQARELGSRLYETIGLRGLATINLPDYIIEKFDVTEILPYRESDYKKNINELRIIFSEQVKDVNNVNEFFSDIRGN